MKVFKAIASAIGTLILIWALETKFNGIPPIAPFINPATGFWQNADSKHIITNQDIKLKGLTGKITVKYDENMVPHIFAGNDYDLYFAQGYITAKDRLWQMDVQTRQAAGRLSEVLGPQLLETDLYHRRMGMVYGAENSLRKMMKDARVKAMIEAYTAGINTYIHQLWKRDYPLEYKLLDYAPEDWTPLNCALLLKLMSETLAGYSDAPALTNVLRKYGPAATNDLFPDYPYRESPIIPTGTKWNFQPLPIPKPSTAYQAQMDGTAANKQHPEGIGSNNWAIAGSKTVNGYPMLANDPHLNLTFPSIWYQVQLTAPGINVTGVSIPGTPCVIIGFNDKVSWGETNVGADVLDFYQIKFKDASHNAYWYNNQWHATKKRTEIINVRGQAPVTDTVVYTHQGPVVYNDAKKLLKNYAEIPVGCAVRWIAHDESDESLTFYLLNRAKNYDDYRQALSYYVAPAQNFIFADNDKDIAITVNGKLPLKYKEQGKYILDGTDPADDWQGWIPFEQNPMAKNPARGFLSSANQSSTDQSYPYYISSDFAAYERGKRINDRLGAMQHATVDSMRLLQTDTYSIAAQDVLPALLNDIDASKLNDDEHQVFDQLKQWNKCFEATSVGATAFSIFWDNLYSLIWDNKFNQDTDKMPSRDRTIKLLLTEPDSHWFDDTHTPLKENCRYIVNKAFAQAVSKLYKKLGKPGEKWQWGRIKQTYIMHLTRQPGLGPGNFIADGTGTTVNALLGGHGPSWRMVVQLGPRVKGYGIFPGGESGNPGSRYYDDMLQTWKSGQLKEILFLHSASEQSARIKSTLTITGN